MHSAVDGPPQRYPNPVAEAIHRQDGKRKHFRSGTVPAVPPVSSEFSVQLPCRRKKQDFAVNSCMNCGSKRPSNPVRPCASIEKQIIQHFLNRATLATNLYDLTDSAR